MRFRTIKKAFLFFLLTMVVLLLLALALLNLPFSHRFITGRVNNILENAHVPISIQSIGRILPKSAVVKGINLYGTDGDTIIYLEKLEASIEPLFLLRKKVIIPSAFLSNASIVFAKPNAERKINIAETFSAVGQNKGKKKKDGKKGWEFSVGSADFSGLKFQMLDSVSGIYIDQQFGSIHLTTRRMSIIDKTILVQKLQVGEASGSIKTSPKKGDVKREEEGNWNFGVANLSLQQINTVYDDPVRRIMLHLALEEGLIKTDKSDLKTKTFDISNIELTGAHASLQLDNHSGQLKENPPATSASFPYDIHCKKLDLENVLFEIGGYNQAIADPTEPAFGIAHLEMGLADMVLNSETAGAKLNSLRFDVSNGFSVAKMNGELDSRNGTTQLKLYAETGNSLLHFEGISGRGIFDLIASTEKTASASVSLKKSRISLKDLAYFQPALLDQPVMNMLGVQPFSLDGGASLSDSIIGFSALTVSQASNFRLTLNGNMNDSVRFGLSGINVTWLKEVLDTLGFKQKIPDFSSLTVDGKLSEAFMSPNFTLEIESDLGNIDLSGSLDFNSDRYALLSQFDRLRLDRIFPKAELGAFTGSGEISGHGMRQNSFTAEAVLSLDSLRYKGYDYTRGKIVGNLAPEQYDFRIIVDDPAFGLDMNTGLNTRDSALSIHSSATFMAMPNSLKLSKDTFGVEGILRADFQKGPGLLEADLSISDLAITTPRKKIAAGHLNTSLRSDTLVTNLTGNSDFYDLAVQVEKPADSVMTIITDYKDYVLSFLDSLTRKRTLQHANLPGTYAKIKINYHEAFDAILKDFHFEDIALEIINSPSNETLSLTMDSRSFKYKTFELGILNTRVTDSIGVISLMIEADSSTIYSHPGNRMLITGHSTNRIGMTRLSIYDPMNELVYDMEISSTADSSNLYFTIPSKELTLNRVKWQLDSGDLFSYNVAGKRIRPNLEMHTDSAFFQLGAEGNEFQNLFTCTVRDLKVGSLIPENILTGNPGGRVSGSLRYSTNGEKSREVNSDLVFSDLSWSDLDFRVFTLKGQYKSDQAGAWTLESHSRLDSAEIVIRSEKSNEQRPVINSELFNFPISAVQPFVKKHLTNLDGFVSGKLNIASPKEIENSVGEILISNGKLRVNTLNSEYKIPEEKISLKGNKIFLDGFTVLDSLNNKLLVNGNIEFSSSGLINTDLEISSSDLQVLNRDKINNEAFYGKIFVDSRLSVKGPLKNPDLKGKIFLTGGTEVFFSKKEDLSISESEKVITFVSETSANDQQPITFSRKQSGFNTSSVETLVEIDPKTRINFNVSQMMFELDLMLQGGGMLNYSLLENNLMNLSGRYEVRKGAADVNIKGWPNKQFQISPGGFIGWEGNIEDPNLQFEAISKVSSSYTNPLDGNIRNVDINVIMKLSDRLSDLNMTFTIATPDEYLMSIINTLGPEEQMWQAMTILLFESIDLPGISNSTDYVTQQVNQVLASQLNQLTKTTIKGVDISFGIDTYTSASSTGAEQTNTSLSYDVRKELLNDRGKVQISGRVNDYSNQQSNSNVSLNNFSFEYQLDSAATKYVKVYNEHSYEDVFEGEVVKTGLGFIYRKSYPTFGDLWKRSGGKNKSKKTGQ